jgi:hypothetical protein
LFHVSTLIPYFTAYYNVQLCFIFFSNSSWFLGCLSFTFSIIALHSRLFCFQIYYYTMILLSNFYFTSFYFGMLTHLFNLYSPVTLLFVLYVCYYGMKQVNNFNLDFYMLLFWFVDNCSIFDVGVSIVVSLIRTCFVLYI